MILYWVCLVIAGLLEPCWVITMERSDRFRKPAWALLTVIILLVSLYLLSYVMTALPIGTTYAIWTGIGAVGTLVVGALLYKESVTSMKIFFAFLIIAGIVGLQVTTVIS
jgi:Membrane transporters of cations and cationic drugs